MVIGIVGPLFSTTKVKRCLKEIDSEIEIKLYNREKVEDTLEVILDCENECDAIMFTGCAVSEYVKEHYNLKKPYNFVSRAGTSIIKALWEIQLSNTSLDKISIDVIEEEILDDIINELSIKLTNLYSRPFSNQTDESEYIDWHIKLFEDGNTNVMITGFTDVYNKLKKKGYPVFRLEPTIPLIKACYKDLKSKHALSKAQYSQIAVQILTFTNNENSIEYYYSNMIKKSDMDKHIVNYARSIQGSLFPFGRNEYIIFSHKGAIQNDDNYSKLMKLSKDIKNIGFSLNVGMGIGTTSYEADTNARKALTKSIDSKCSHIYMVDENDNIIGPLGEDNKINYTLKVSDEYLISISEKTGLSCESIVKIIALNEARKSKIYDSKKLADLLDLSERSARRILQKIVVSNLGQVIAKETSNGKGRPKNLTEILF
ncbi:MAG: transcriptional regulator [Romboutsia sp.]